jgi:tetratricopeptide (TPR) repeat protein
LAVNKRKVLDAARKFAQKGAKEKALKEYHSLLKLDPRDAKLHLEIGDCYRRWGQIEEAITQYARVADQYKDDGFDARAVAVFKQILNLDPKRYTAHISLSELYQRMGLDSEALSALQAAADGYHKDGQKREALELLRRMATLDPTNTTSRLKVAELLRQEGMEDDAVSEYEAVVKELGRQGAIESILAVQERIIELRPDRADVLVGIARRLLELRKPERAEPFAKRALKIDPDQTETYEVLCDIYKELSNDDELAATTRTLAKIYRDRGDSDRARELAQRIPLSLELEAGSSEPARTVDETESAFLSDDELLDDDFLASDTSDVSELKPVSRAAAIADDELELDDPDDDVVLADGPAQRASGNTAPAPQGDPDQLLAEASVYLRYGKRAQAMASLKAVLDQDPEHRGALEKLGDAYAEGDENEQAVEMWRRAAECARAEGDADGLGVLRDRIASLDPAAARSLVAATPEPIAVDAEAGIEFDVESELSDDDSDSFEIDVSVGEDAASPKRPVEDESAGFEIDLGEGDDETARPAAQEAAASDEIDFGIDDGLGLDAASDDAGAGLDAAVASQAEDEVEIDVDLDLDAEAEDEDGSEVAASRDSQSAANGSSTTSQQVAEDLEEAEFYFQQELLDEAEAIYRRILKLAPSHPSALLRLGEIAAAKGGDPGSVAAGSGAGKKAGAAAKADSAKSEQTARPGKKTAKTERAEKAEKSADKEREKPAKRAAAAPVSKPARALELEEADDDLEADTSELDLDPDAFGLAEPPAEDSTEVAELSLDDDDTPPVAMDVPPKRPPRRAARADVTLPFEDLSSLSSDANEDSGSFDLAAELRDVLAETGDAPGDSRDGSLRSTVEDGFEAIFADFKQGVSATLGEEDTETRYDLGIAYREMGLFEDAIGEFRLCLASADRKLASLHMMGLCALDLGRAGDACNHLEQALALADLPPQQVAGLNFDLGRALEAKGDVPRARDRYQSVLEADPEFPGVAERIAGLGQAGGSLELRGAFGRGGAEEGGFESFDDLMAEAQHDEDDATEQSESFESFDDVITEAEAVIGDEAEAEEEPEPTRPRPAAPPPAAAPAPSTSDGKKPPRKKKISFV